MKTASIAIIGGLLLMQATSFAYMSPTTGKFLSRDPIEESGGLNLSGYVNNNPVSYTDPFGLALYAFDGTGNDGRHLPDGMGTSVYLLMQGYGGQNVVYEPGVGSALGTRTIGGAFGLGATARVEDAYTRFMQIYKQGSGDTTIDIIGFSRGAAEAREFANLIYQRGDGSGLTTRHSTYGKNTITTTSWGTPCSIPQIRFVGLFDTVATSLHSFDLNLPPNVQMGRQAKAWDEKRYSFPVTSIFPGLSGQNLAEQWFPGDHSDIGHNHLTLNNDLVWGPLEYIRSAGVSVGVPFGPLPPHTLTGDTTPHNLAGTFPFLLIPNTAPRH